MNEKKLLENNEKISKEAYQLNISLNQIGDGNTIDDLDINIDVKSKEQPLTENDIIDLFRKVAKKIIDESGRSEGRMTTFAEQKYKIRLPNIYSESEDIKSSLYDAIMQTDLNYSMTGPGGSGKSFMQISISEQLINSKKEKDKCIIPIHIPLNIFNNKSLTLLQYILDKMGINKESYEIQILRWLEKVREPCMVYPLFFLDGFNELTSDDVQNRIVSEVRDFQRMFPRIRYIISSRKNFSNLFSASGSGTLPFKEYNVVELERSHINHFIRKVLSSNDWKDEKINEILEKIDQYQEALLSRPMALVMYVKILLNQELNIIYPHPECKKTGELIENFIYLLQRSPDTKEFRENNKEEFENSNKMLSYIGYQMNIAGVFRLSIETLKSYFNEYIGEITFNKFKKCVTVRELMIFPDEKSFDNEVRFIHQNFRDYFCADFLRKNLKTSYEIADPLEARKHLKKYFNSKIDSDVLSLLGEIMSEHKYIVGDSRTNLSNLNKVILHCFNDSDNIDDAIVISQLIEIVQITRENDLSNFSFEGLNLSKTSLNNNKLYHYNVGTAIFNNSYLTDYTFRANAHAGAIFMMAFINENYLISFSREAIWCYDMLQRIHYPLCKYENNSAIRALVFISTQNRIITGDDDGYLIVWKYYLEDSLFKIEIEKTYSSYNENIQNMVYSEEDNSCFFVLKNGNAYWLSTDTLETPKCFYYGNMSEKMCAITLDDNDLYISCGKKIAVISICDALSGQKYTNAELKNVYIIKDSEVDYIFDITTRIKHGKTILLISANGRENQEENYYSKILYANVSDGLTDETNLKIVEGSRRKCESGFKGYNNFSLRYGEKIYVCIYLDNPAIPDIYEIEINVGKWETEEITARLVECNVDSHDMSVECAVPLVLPNHMKGIATSGIDRTIDIISFHQKDASIFAHLPGHFNGIHGMDYYEGTIFAAMYSGAVSAWKKNNRNQKWDCTHVYPVHKYNEWVWEVKHYIYNNVSYLASCSYDNTIIILRPDTEEIICRITKEYTNNVGLLKDGKVYSIVPLSNGNIIAACGNFLRLFEIDYDNKECYPIAQKEFISEVRFIQKKSNEHLRVITHSGSVYDIELCEDEYGQKEINCDELITKKGGIKFRCADSFAMKNECELFVVGGSNDITRSIYFEVYSSGDMKYVISQEEAKGCRSNYGISQLSLHQYKDRILLFIAAYSGNVSIYDVTIPEETYCMACLQHYDQMLDVMAHNDYLYCSSLDGKVFCWRLSEILDNNIEKVNILYAKEYDTEIFQTSAGFIMNYVDFSQATCDFSEEYINLIQQYRTVFQKDSKKPKK